MSRCINKIKYILLTVICFINDTNCLCLYGNATLSLKFHIIKNLRLHLPACKKPRFFDNTVCKCGFAVVNMCYDTKISDIGLFNSLHCIPPLFFSIAFYCNTYVGYQSKQYGIIFAVVQYLFSAKHLIYHTGEIWHCIFCLL